MAGNVSDRSEASSAPRVSPAAWAVLAMLAATALLLYTGYTTGEWRGVIVTEVQIVVVAFATWLVLRSSD